MTALMQREFCSWRRGGGQLCLQPDLSLRLEAGASGAWPWDPSLLARDCLGTVALESVLGAEVLGRMGVCAALLWGLQRTGR